MTAAELARLEAGMDETDVARAQRRVELDRLRRVDPRVDEALAKLRRMVEAEAARRARLAGRAKANKLDKRLVVGELSETFRKAGMLHVRRQRPRIQRASSIRRCVPSRRNRQRVARRRRPAARAPTSASDSDSSDPPPSHRRAAAHEVQS